MYAPSDDAPLATATAVDTLTGAGNATDLVIAPGPGGTVHEARVLTPPMCGLDGEEVVAINWTEDLHDKEFKILFGSYCVCVDDDEFLCVNPNVATSFRFVRPRAEFGRRSAVPQNLYQILAGKGRFVEALSNSRLKSKLFLLGIGEKKRTLFRVSAIRREDGRLDCIIAVSYTHLTLPTIYSV